jgi:phosphatidylserine synthase
MVFNPFSLFRNGSGFEEPLSGIKKTTEGYKLLNTLERVDLFTVLTMIAGSFFLKDPKITIGVSIGGLLMLVNFKLLRKILRKSFLNKKTAIFYGLKFLGIIMAIILIVFTLKKWINLLAFAVGTLSFFISFWIVGLKNLKRET